MRISRESREKAKGPRVDGQNARHWTAEALARRRIFFAGECDVRSLPLVQAVKPVDG